MKLFKKSLIFMLVMIFSVSLLAACGGKAEKEPGASHSSEAGGDEGAASGELDVADTLNIYSALPDSEIPTYVTEFEKASGIKVNYVRLSAGEMLARVESETGNPQAALMHGGSSDTYVAAAERDLLVPYQSPELSNVPEHYLDSDGVWNPFYVGAIGFAVNTEWFDEHNVDIPKTWDDLLKPEFKDQIMMAHPASSGTAYTVLATMIQLKGEDGWDYMKKLNENIRQYTKSGAAPANSVGLGEAAIGIIFSHDGLKPKTEGYPVDVVFPQDGTGYEVGAMALIKGASPAEHEAAKKFIDWSISKEGQEAFITSESSRLPLNKNADVTPGLIKIDELPVIDYDAVWAGEHKDEFIEKFIEVVASDADLK